MPQDGAAAMHAPSLSRRSLVLEIEDRLKRGSAAQRAEILHRITELFLERASSIVEEQVAFFSEVFEQLIEEIELQALITLSEQLAPVETAPVNIIHRMSRHDEIGVAGPVLEKSNRLSDEDLVEIARTKSQAHLGAIAGRERINPTVTDVLVDRGESAVATKVAANPGASFSNAGFNMLLMRAERDENLAEKVSRRPELTPELLKMLVLRATDAVRERMVAKASPGLRDKINQILPVVADRVERIASSGIVRNSGFSVKTLRLHDAAEIRSQLADFAAVGRLQEMIGAFTVLTELPAEIVRRLLQLQADDGVLILCKAAGLGWPAVKAVLAARTGLQPLAQASIDGDFDHYFGLSIEVAQRVVRFLRARKNMTEAQIRNILDDNSGSRRRTGIPPPAR